MSARVTVLTGGVGGAKLVEGLQQIVPGTHLTAIVNTGDDFEHFGLPISPDIDTLQSGASAGCHSERASMSRHVDAVRQQRHRSGPPTGHDLDNHHDRGKSDYPSRSAGMRIV